MTTDANPNLICPLTGVKFVEYVIFAAQLASKVPPGLALDIDSQKKVTSSKPLN